MKFRHELKYLINEGDAALLRERLSSVLKTDTHTINGQYHIRSLYFDDYWNSALSEKLSGVSNRKKYRIRVYNKNDSFISLECKNKSAAYIAKEHAVITPDELDMIYKGKYDFLLKKEEELCHKFYHELISNVLRPKVYVDYEREPYILESGDVRITFDKNVRAAYPGYKMFDDNLAFQHVLEPGKIVLEVKYTEFLPKIVSEILPTRAAEMTAVSKYVLCMNKVNYLHNITMHE